MKITITKLEPYQIVSSGHDGYDGTMIHFSYTGKGFDITGTVEIETDQDNRENYPSLSLSDAYGLLANMAMTI
ncbi:hypothetical protein LCGC14_2223080 [marine sediment metagenome]|uniref:Uncharacterized protein n=1 Tax=marine sediment metagenome TaxID=412755 RepID=A0A0F9DAG6_9ZZZZ